MVRLHRGEKGLRWQWRPVQTLSQGCNLRPVAVLCQRPFPHQTHTGAYTAADWFADCFARPAFEIGLGQAQGQGEETALYARLLETLVIATLV